MIAVFAGNAQKADEALAFFRHSNWKYLGNITDLCGGRYEDVFFVKGWAENPVYQVVNFRCAFQDSFADDALLAVNAAFAAECTRRMNTPVKKSERGSAMATRESHTLQIPGSSPGPATTPPAGQPHRAPGAPRATVGKLREEHRAADAAHRREIPKEPG